MSCGKTPLARCAELCFSLLVRPGAVGIYKMSLLKVLWALGECLPLPCSARGLSNHSTMCPKYNFTALSDGVEVRAHLCLKYAHGC